MKNELTDTELLAELKRRFDNNALLLDEEKSLTAQLNAVNEKLILSLFLSLIPIPVS